MDSINLYQPTNLKLPFIKSLNFLDTDLKNYKHNICLIGFCCDAGVKRNNGRVGAAEGPDFIRESLVELNLEKNIIDFGNIKCGGNLEQSQKELSIVLTQLRNHNIFPIVIGGGHETAWGNYQGIKSEHKNNLEIVNFDAHFDLRDLIDNKIGSSGTPFWQIALDSQKNNQTFNYSCIGIQPNCNSDLLFNKAKDLKVNYSFADDLHKNNSIESKQIIKTALAKQNNIYLSVCLDVFSIEEAPGVSAAQKLGIYYQQAKPLYLDLIKSNRLVAFDVVEFAPKYDIDNKTSNLAATIIQDFIQNFNF